MFLYSCSKEGCEKPVYAGVYNSDFIYHEFENPLEIKLKPDTVLRLCSGSDSIDINLDGKFDLFIKQLLSLDYGSEDRNIFDYDDFPYCKLYLKNTLEVATKLELYPRVRNESGKLYWTDTLKLNTRIDEYADWSGGDESTKMWTVYPKVFPVTYGCWYNISSQEKYVGIRMKIHSRYKYGWIKVNQMIRDSIKFVSYAIEK